MSSNSEAGTDSSPTREPSSPTKRRFKMIDNILQKREQALAAIYADDADTLRDCLYNGVSLLTLSVDTTPPLHVAVQQGSTSVVQLLLSLQNADELVSEADEFGRTALHWARSVPIVTMLINAGADPDNMDSTGKKPLECMRDLGEGHYLLLEQKFQSHQATKKSDLACEDADNKGREGIPLAPLSGLLSFTDACNRLKATPRTGWVMRGVNNPEGVSAHSWGVAMLALIASKRARGQLYSTKAIEIALVHDLAESIVGDLVPGEVPKEEKRKLESNAMSTLCDELEASEDGLGNYIMDLWLQYEFQTTSEAQLVKQCDKLEMVLQADRYERDQAGLDLSEFFDYTVGMITIPALKSIDDALRASRNARKQSEAT